MNTDSIYYLAATYFDGKRNKEECIRLAITYVLTRKNQDEIRNIIGDDAYLDYIIHSKKVSEWNLNYFLEEVGLIDFNLKNESDNKKIKFLDKNFQGKKSFKRINIFLAEKIRKEHFPNSGLESVLIANGIEIKKNKN